MEKMKQTYEERLAKASEMRTVLKNIVKKLTLTLSLDKFALFKNLEILSWLLSKLFAKSSIL